jgi:hypothetical protein
VLTGQALPWYLQSTFPASNATGVSPPDGAAITTHPGTITLTFSRAFNAATLAAGITLYSNGTVVSGSFQRSNNDLSLMMTPSNLSGPVNGPGRKSDCAVPRFLHRVCFRDWNHNHYNSGDASSGRGQWGAAGLADYVVFFRAGRLHSRL